MVFPRSRRGLAASRALAALLLRGSLGDILDSGYGDRGQFMDGCGDAMAAALEDVKDPRMRQTGELMMKSASVSSMLLPPPAGLVIGGGLLVAGGLMEAFGKGDHEATVADAINFMGRNFEKVNLKLEALQSSVQTVSRMMDQVQQDVGTLYEDLHLGATDVRRINGVYLEFMGRIYAAKGDFVLASDARAYAEQQADQLSDRVFEVFDPSNIDNYLQRLLADTERAGGYSDAFVPALAYQQLLATRLKLFTIQFAASIWKENRDNANAERYVSDLHSQVLGYEEIVRRLRLPVNRTASYLLSGHNRCQVANAALGLPPSAGRCCCSLGCPEGVTCGCPESVSKGEDADSACGVVSTTTTTTTSTTTTCTTDTNGTCRFLGCSSWRGPTVCIANKCICRSGYCAVNGACSSTDCTIDSGGTCRFKSCDASRGPTECRSGYCMCADGFCAVHGLCVPSGLHAAENLELPGVRRSAALRLAALAALAVSSAAFVLAAALRGRRAMRAEGREPLLSGD